MVTLSRQGIFGHPQGSGHAAETGPRAVGGEPGRTGGVPPRRARRGDRREGDGRTGTRAVRAMAGLLRAGTEHRRDHGDEPRRGSVILVDTNMLLDLLTARPRKAVKWSRESSKSVLCRRQQTRRPLPVADQDVAVGEGGGLEPNN